MKILVAPLDWGLGHASRCIPIIHYLLEMGCDVVIAADGRAMQLLKNEFSYSATQVVEFLKLEGYNIQYPENDSMVATILWQMPKIVKAIVKEHKQLKKIIDEKKIDAVISDNRYGMWSDKAPCVFITHQIGIKVAVQINNSITSSVELLMYQLVKRFISKYTICWIPDCEKGPDLSGELSHKYILPNTKFIGLLSRFRPQSVSSKKKYDLLIVISGPEPQRTEFEKRIIHQLSFFNLKVLIVQGLPEKNEQYKLFGEVEVVSNLPSEKLQEAILSSEIVLSRSGYSSVMDYAILKNKVIFVPTPGQTEQEYLADYLSIQNIAYSISQNELDIEVAIAEARKYSGFVENYCSLDFKVAVDELLGMIKKRTN